MGKKWESLNSINPLKWVDLNSIHPPILSPFSYSSKLSFFIHGNSCFYLSLFCESEFLRKKQLCLFRELKEGSCGWDGMSEEEGDRR